MLRISTPAFPHPQLVYSPRSSTISPFLPYNLYHSVLFVLNRQSSPRSRNNKRLDFKLEYLFQAQEG